MHSSLVIWARALHGPEEFRKGATLVDLRRAERVHSTRVWQATLGVLLSVASPASATYSVLAVDKASGEMGGFSISCISTHLSLSEVVRLSDAHIIAAQGYFFEAGRDEVVLQLQRGEPPSVALARALAPGVDPPSASSGPTFRQYAALTLGGVSAQHSGSDLLPFAGHLSGEVGTITYAIQGNVLTESAVLDRLEEGFLEVGTDIPERLIAALRTLAASGGGDARCAPRSGDAGYSALRLPNAPQISVEIVEPTEEIASLLATRIQEEVDAARVNSPPNDPEAPGLSPSVAGAGKSGGCSHSPERSEPWPLLLWGLLSCVAHRTHRRATKCDS